MTDYARIETADGIDFYPLPDDVAAREAALTDLLTRHGIPADWIDSPDRGLPRQQRGRSNASRLRGRPDLSWSPPVGNGWDVSVAEGPPYVAQALADITTVHEALP